MGVGLEKFMNRDTFVLRAVPVVQFQNAVSHGSREKFVSQQRTKNNITYDKGIVIY